MISIRSTRRAAAAALLLLAAGCRFPFSPGDGHDGARHDLRVARSHWAALGSDSYTFTVQPLCFCVQQAMRVTVTNGQVVSRVFVDSGQPVPAGQQTALSTVEGMFEVIEDAIANDAESISAQYDPRGVPVQVFIDYEANVADEEFGWGVTSFTLQ
ncbi:MAG TPA: DUF6174 domain-containing protein [Longimicrobium sp.]|jgi:hypothetical protein